jgi:hypothetical protein
MFTSLGTRNLWNRNDARIYLPINIPIKVSNQLLSFFFGPVTKSWHNPYFQ